MKTLNIKTITASLLALSIVVLPSFASAEMLYRQLQVGSRGADVSTLQSFLATDVSIYPSGLVTGYFGLLTRAGVMRFQAANGISQVGRVGPQTMAAINARLGNGFPNSPFVEAAPAFVGNVAGVSVSGNVATFYTTTNVPTRAVAYYSTSPIMASENLLTNPVTVVVSGDAVRTDTNLRTAHSISSASLQSNTTYYSMIVVTDANGVVSVIKPASFRTN